MYFHLAFLMSHLVFFLLSDLQLNMHTAKSTCRSSAMYLQQTIYESPSSPIVSEGFERNLGPETSKLFNVMVRTLCNFIIIN